MLLAVVKQYVSRVQQLTEMTIFTISYRWFSGTTQSNSDMPGPPSANLKSTLSNVHQIQLINYP